MLLRLQVGPLYHAQMRECNTGGMTTGRPKPKVLGAKPVTMSLCLPQIPIPHVLSWEWTQASTVRNQWLNTWTMACSPNILWEETSNCVPDLIHTYTHNWISHNPVLGTKHSWILANMIHTCVKECVIKFHIMNKMYSVYKNMASFFYQYPIHQSRITQNMNLIPQQRQKCINHSL